MDIVEQIFTSYAKKNKSVIHREEMQAYLYNNIKTII